MAKKFKELHEAYRNWNFQRGRKGLEKKECFSGRHMDIFGNIADRTSMQDAYELSK